MGRGQGKGETFVKPIYSETDHHVEFEINVF